ncbi:MAG TPA: PD-(D/E)XK nuclease family protein [Synechococcales cyanobacterium M55_K2018_004]|nr:PD-(D/E)XK nuclease family protein [Synechococcales cyanobacterium M55_K2018_004]
MTYVLSASKLQTYYRCPLSYYFRYERKLPGAAFYSSAALGTSLHQTLAKVYDDWHYQDPIPRYEWVEYCWAQYTGGLTASQINDGRKILRRYYDTFIASESAIRRPLAVEGRIQGTLRVQDLEFTLSGRYDRLDYLDDGLELIDYKSSKESESLINDEELDLQIGLYYLALEQRYQRHLKRLSLVYLRSGDKLSFDVTPSHRNRVEQVIGELALQLRYDRNWTPFPGEQCDRCAYSRFCPAVRAEPDPLPEEAKPEPGLQLVLSLT